MRISGVDTIIRSSREEAKWCIEWTYASGAPVYDKTNSDQDQNIKTTAVITDTGTGIVTVKVPKANRIKVLSKNLVPASPTTGSQYLIHEVTDFNAASGTCVVRFFDLDGTPTATDPADGSRYMLCLLLS